MSNGVGFTGPLKVRAGTASGNVGSLKLETGTREAGNNVTSLQIVPVANTAAANIPTISNASHGQATTWTIADPGSASDTFVGAAMAQTLSNKTLSAPIISGNSSINGASNVVVKIISAGQAALASAGKVVVQAHNSATSQFAILGMRVLKSTGLSGNSGDRLVALTDGTLVFNGSGITAALAGTPITTRPAGTGNPDCGTSVDPSASTAGADIFLQYTGGTTDYNAGSLKVEVTLAQVTA